RGDVITSFYNLYLQRNPSSSDTSYWQSQFSAGVTQLSMQQTIIGSAEYAANPATPSAGSIVRWTWSVRLSRLTAEQAIHPQISPISQIGEVEADGFQSAQSAKSVDQPPLSTTMNHTKEPEEGRPGTEAG